MYYRNNSQYKTADEYYKERSVKDVKHNSMNQFTYSVVKPIRDRFDSNKEAYVNDINYYQDLGQSTDDMIVPVREVESTGYVEGSKLEDTYNRREFENSSLTDMKLTTKTYKNTSNPAVWGPSFWFTLHNGASKYPVNASKNYQERMKGFILGIPMMLPCPGCKPHAIAYIESIKPKLDSIVSGRDNLFEFFVDFHNEVNDRYNKRNIGYDEAYKMYRQGVRLTTTNFW